MFLITLASLCSHWLNPRSSSNDLLNSNAVKYCTPWMRRRASERVVLVGESFSRRFATRLRGFAAQFCRPQREKKPLAPRVLRGRHFSEFQVSLLWLNIHFGTNIGKTNEFYLFKENLYEQFLIKTARFCTSLILWPNRLRQLNINFFFWIYF